MASNSTEQPITKRLKKTESQCQTLEEMYEAGMKSYGTDNVHARDLLRQAVESTGLTESQVKVRYSLYCVNKFSKNKLFFTKQFSILFQNWIDHKRKKNVSSKKNEKIPCKKSRGYDIFRSEYLSSLSGR